MTQSSTIGNILSCGLQKAILAVDILRYMSNEELYPVQKRAWNVSGGQTKAWEELADFLLIDVNFYGKIGLTIKKPARSTLVCQLKKAWGSALPFAKKYEEHVLSISSTLKVFRFGEYSICRDEISSDTLEIGIVIPPEGLLYGLWGLTKAEIRDVGIISGI